MDTSAQNAILDSINTFKYATTQEFVLILGIAILGIITIFVGLASIRWFFDLFDSNSRIYVHTQSVVSQPDFDSFSKAFDQKDDVDWGIPRNTQQASYRHINTSSIEGLNENTDGRNLGGNPDWQQRN